MFPLRQMFQSSFLNVVLLALGVSLAYTNSHLVRENKNLQRELNATQQAGIGQFVDSIVGLNLDEQPVKIPVGSAKSTILMVFSPTCGFCKINWPAWNSILADSKSGNSKIVLTDLSASATSEYIAQHNAQSALFMHHISPDLISDLHLGRTPQTIVIGPDKKIEGVWTGPLSSKDVDTIKGFM